MIKKILIANRGEIACRVIRTARKLGYRTVAVYSEADAQAPHVSLADEAVCIGPAPAAESYLKADVLLAACRQTGANAIHPGYGFLSENAAFAQACRDAGVIFIGPSPEAIRVMGDKAGAKRAMIEAGVPCAPGYLGDKQDDATLIEQAERDMNSRPLLSILKRRGQHTFYVVQDTVTLPLRLTADRVVHKSKIAIEHRDDVCTTERLREVVSSVSDHLGLTLIKVTKVSLGDDWFYTYVVDYG